MAQNKELLNRIQAIKSIQQVTQAMRMVSVAKLEKNKKKYQYLKSYSLSLQKLYEQIPPTTESLYTHTKATKSILAIVITSDRGLCGSFNNAVIAQLIRTRQQAIQTKKQITFLPIGKKAKEFLRKKEWALIESYATLPENSSLTFATNLYKFVTNSFTEKKYNEIQLIYQKDNHATPESVITERLLPLSPPAPKKTEDTLLCEPDRTTLSNYILSKIIFVALYQKILIAKIAEHKTRMLTMSQASDNANDLSQELTLKYNRIRQSNITRELLDISGGVEALK